MSNDECRMTKAAAAALLSAFSLQPSAFLSADEFTVRTSPTDQTTFEAEVYGTSSEGVLTLLKPDGSILYAPPGAVLERKTAEPPKPLSHAELAETLVEKFTPELTRTHVAEPFVIALVLAAPVEQKDERLVNARIETMFEKVEDFVLSFDEDFTQWSREMGLPTEPPSHPLVMVIFETDEAFEEYAKEVMSGDGLSAGVVSGFYSHITNWLAVRLDECDNFQLPLHEGIHQQVYNRGWYKRTAPVPTWFDEGVATGFENDGAEVKGDPSKVNAVYATKSAAGKMAVSFADVISEDRSFRGDVMAGDAYTRAWGLHWLLVNTRPEEYAAYVKRLGTREPLDKVATEGRVAEFEETFGVSVATLQKEYEQTLNAEARRQGVRPIRDDGDGALVKQDQGGKTYVQVVTNGGAIRAKGKVRNINPFRTLTFKVSVLPTGADPIVWYLPNVGSKKTQTLKPQTMVTGSRSFRVEIESAIPGGQKEAAWRREAGGGRP